MKCYFTEAIRFLYLNTDVMPFVGAMIAIVDCYSGPAE